MAYNESEIQEKEPFHAQLDAFWINKKKNQMAWLILFYDWRNQSDNSKIESHTNLQGVNIEITFFDENRIKGGINIRDIFPDRYASKKNKSGKKISPKSKLEGIFSLGKEKFSFRIINPLKKNSENWEGMYDPKGNLNYVSKEAKISDKDIEKVLVEREYFKTRHFDSNRKLKNLEPRELEEYFRISFYFKKDSQEKIKNSMEGIHSVEMGIINRNKIILKVYFSSLIDKRKIELLIDKESQLENLIERLDIGKK